jgi:hypothetical protein
MIGWKPQKTNSTRTSPPGGTTSSRRRKSARCSTHGSGPHGPRIFDRGLMPPGTPTTPSGTRARRRKTGTLPDHDNYIPRVSSPMVVPQPAKCLALLANNPEKHARGRRRGLGCSAVAEKPPKPVLDRVNAEFRGVFGRLSRPGRAASRQPGSAARHPSLRGSPTGPRM